MRRLVSAFAIVVASAPVAWASAPAPLTTLQVIHSLTNAQASHQLPVAFEATVNYYRGYEQTLFVQDHDAAIYVSYPTDLKLIPGDRVLVRGKTQSSFNPIVNAESVTLLHHGDPPKPQPVTFDQMIRAETDCKLVSLRATIHAADWTLSQVAPVHYERLQLLMDGGYLKATVDSSDAGAFEGMLDAEVELTGVASEEFDSKMHETGILMHVQSLSDLKVIKRANSNPWALPATPMDRVITVFHVSDSTQRVRVHGTITYYLPGSAVVLQDGSRSIWIDTQTYQPLQIGDAADATGFPDVHDGFVNLTHGEIHDSLTPAPIEPVPSTWESLTPRGFDSPGHHDDLVSIEGRVVTEVREASQDELVLAIDGKQFSVIYRHPEGHVSASKDIPLGSRVRVTGICVLENSNPFIYQVPFDILLRSFDDITIIARPSFLTVRNLIIVVGLLLAVVFFVGARGWLLERRVHHQSSALARLESRRSRILEDINGSRPLAEIIEEIIELASFRLDGATCWCQIVDGALLGACPSDLSRLRVVRTEIPARFGASLGTLFAAFELQAKPLTAESEALAMACGLSSLAIETRRLYSDLLHRSEFDLLTDVHNRFSLDKHLGTLIEEARMAASIFGLIYIDLDEFKQINDVYGHQVGDIYLQEVSVRLKGQLRGRDTLARLGGDEFAALITVVRNRADAQDIVQRLEHCFDEPFSIEGCVLHGSASFGIALYPEDGASKNSLLNAADAAMYEAKNAKRKTRALAHR